MLSVFWCTVVVFLVCGLVLQSAIVGMLVVQAVAA